jgi:hypothetical protein
MPHGPGQGNAPFRLGLTTLHRPATCRSQRANRNNVVDTRAFGGQYHLCVDGAKACAMFSLDRSGKQFTASCGKTHV